MFLKKEIKSCHAELGSVSKISSKKSAMFGLDARIALAIFGALSVITGAALYSAIQKATVIAAVTELSEIGKAYEAYQIDTGSDLSLDTTNPMHLNIGYLAKDTTPPTPGWKGPYLQYDLNGSKVDNLKHNKYAQVLLIQTTSGTWGDTIGFPACSTNCSVYSRLNNVPLDIAEAIDEYVDGTKNDKDGMIRIYHTPGGENHVLMEVGRTLR